MFVILDTMLLLETLSNEEYNIEHVQADQEKGTWRLGGAPDCLASHACVPVSNPADPEWVNLIVSPSLMWLGDHVNGGFVELRLKPV